MIRREGDFFFVADLVELVDGLRNGVLFVEGERLEEPEEGVVVLLVVLGIRDYMGGTWEHCCKRECQRPFRAL